MRARPLTYRAASCAAVLLFACSACGSDEPAEIEPLVTYDSFGQPFEPAAALPIEAVLAEAAEYDGLSLMVEGVLYDDCAHENCWMTMRTDSLQLEIQPPAFDVSAQAAGRRGVVHGRFSSTDTSRTLSPTGVMVEKVRS